MKTKLQTLALAAVVFQSSVLLAADAFDPVATTKTIAPFVDERTVAVAHVDVSRFDLGPTFDYMGKVAPDMKEELSKAQASAQSVLDQFRKAGGREMFVVVSLADVPESSPFVVVPLADGAVESALANILPLEAHRMLHGALVLAARATLDRLASQRPTPRPDVARAFEAAGDTAAQVLIVPTADSRRVIEELSPTLPAEVGGGPAKTLTRGALWVAMGVNTTSPWSASLVLQSQDREAAGALRRHWLEVYKFLGRHREIVAALPEFDQIAAKLVPEIKGDKLYLSIDERNQGAELLRAAVEPGLRSARAASQRAQSINNLKQMALAMHVYADVHKHLPPAASSGPDGKPLLSWRVQLLPHLGMEKLYREFHLEEPWDSEHNRALVERMPEVYRSPLSTVKTPGRTSYLAPRVEGTILDGGDAVSFKDITDGTSNTILIVESNDDRAVIWTRPDDLPVDLDRPQAGLGELPGGWFLAAVADGSVQSIHVDSDPETLRRLFLRADGKPVDWNKLKGR
ncbi:MAG TPA: DUF1559 domain-containing protein [Pirellulales bacterium]|nr:DUF1559 domain-containing protein [Pirellulales bacterium]